MEILLTPEVYIPIIGVLFVIAGYVVKKTANKTDDKVYDYLKGLWTNRGK